MLVRGAGLDEGDLTFLREVRDDLADWPLGADPRRSLTFRADGLRQIAMLCATVGQFDEMLACLGRESEALDELERLAPGDAQVVRRRLDLMHQERHALHRIGRLHDVIASARRSLALFESPVKGLVVRPTEDAAARIQLGTHLIRVGVVEEARRHLREGLEGLREARRASPDDRGISQQLVISLYNSAIVADDVEWDDLHRQWLEELVTVGEDSLQRSPGDRDVFARSVALGLAGLMMLADREGRFSDALSLAERWRGFCHEQVPEGDGVTTMHREAANADMRSIDLLLKTGDAAAARALLEHAAPFVRRLYEAEPAVFDTAMLQASMLRKCGELLVDSSDPAGRMPYLTDEIAVLEQWVKFTPQADFVQTKLAEARRLLDTVTERVATAAATAKPE